MDPLFPALPEDLAGLTVEELTAYLNGHLEIVALVEARDADTLGDRDMATILSEMTAGVEAVERLRDALSALSADTDEFEAEIKNLATRAGVAADADPAELSAEAGEGDEGEGNGEGEGDGEGEGEEPAADLSADADAGEGEPEGVEDGALVASSELAKRLKGRPVKAPAKHMPAIRVTEREAPALVAAAGIRGITPGERLDRKTLAQALIETHRVTQAPAGGRVEVVVASASIEYPEERRLRAEQAEANGIKLREQFGNGRGAVPDAIRASGGFCAPFPPIYDLPLLAVSDRPVRDGLPTFQADRGGITYPTPISLAAMADAVTYVTGDEDEEGGTTAAKSVLVIDCDPFQSAEVAAIAARVRHGNMGARSWPERVDNVTDLVEAYHARIAETALLDAIGALSTDTDDEAKYGAVSTFFQSVLKTAARYRSRHRMRSVVRGGPRLRLLIPDWIPDLLVSDSVHTEFDRWHVQTEIESKLNALGFNVSWYMDTETGEGMIAAAQADGALEEWFGTAVAYLFAEGTFTFLDQGRIDLGVVRDSVLNETNDFEMFWETFEGLAMTGYESIRITMTLCANGSTAAPATAFTCS